MDVEDGGYVRLYKQDGQLVALVSEPQRIRLIVLGSEGAVLEEQVLLQDRWLDMAPFTVGLTTVPDTWVVSGSVSGLEWMNSCDAPGIRQPGTATVPDGTCDPPLDLHDFADQKSRI